MKTDLTVLLVDDEEHILNTFGMLLERASYAKVKTMSDSRCVLPFLSAHRKTIVVLDLMMPHLSGSELLPQIRADFPEVPVIVMTAANDLEKAVDCMKSGAFDFIVKPVDEKRFLSCISKAMEISGLHDEIERLKTSLFDEDLKNPDAFSTIITRSSNVKAIFRYIEAIAASRQPVLITGETGVGKGLLAKALHVAGGVDGKFVAVDVAGLDEAMFADTLFGHEKGAYTGADAKRDGLIAKAARGTLFLDEIGDLDEASQVKLLKLIEEKTYYPLGSDILKKSDARIVVATNKDIKALSADRRFRRDLYYRLNGHHIHMPPLRERTEDIPLLVDLFVSRAAQEMNKRKPAIPPELYPLLSAYHFPGNVRELRSFVYDAVACHKARMLSMESFKEAIRPEHYSADVSRAAETDNNILAAFFGHFPSLKEIEAFTIEQALRLSDDNQGTAALMLGISRQALNNRIRARKKKDDGNNVK